MPGPGSYNTPDSRDFALPEGGRLSRAPPVERLRLDGDSNPPPGTYGIPNDPNRPRIVNGKFGKDPKVTKFIRDEQLRARHVPGPHYDVMDAMESAKPFCPEGGRCMMAHKPASYFDQITKLADSKPGPDAYDLPCAIQPYKSKGKCVWRYHSETLKDSRRAVAHAIGDRNEVPGPGTYTLPDPAPLSVAPSLKGRDLPHAMPAPFSYNCKPDFSGKYNSLAPVRQQNSGDQIYGRDLKKGTAGGKVVKRAASASPADQAVEKYVPVSLMVQEDGRMPPPVAVQWRSGGFTDLRKSKSAGAIAMTPEHPALKETVNRYPMMSKKHRTPSTFLPLATRRSELVRTHRRSEEVQHMERKKWELQALTNDITVTVAETMEPLNEEKLRQQAMQGLSDKARERMRLEGVSSDQQELVLAEIPRVYYESMSSVLPSESSPEKDAAEYIAQEQEAAFAMQEPSAEPPPREAEVEHGEVLEAAGLEAGAAPYAAEGVRA